MREENEVRDGIDRQTCDDAFKIARQNHAIGSVHPRSNYRLLAADISPEKQASDGVHCDTSRLL